ncbi:MAG: M6 family metalloprotease domain-containing protein, partial [Thiotrichaceae bacterium]|nr:M6 family metalloprotease domain-containing protein [Thiotrichaceae bacterium]
ITVTVTDQDESLPAFTSADSFTATENQTAIGTVIATDNTTVSYSLTAGADQAQFAIDTSSGILTFITAPDFEVPTDSDTNNAYQVTVTATDTASNTTDQLITVTVTDVLEGTMSFTSPNTQILSENTKEISIVKTNDPSTLFSISGGDDSTLFSIDSASGLLSFSTARDFENPSDTNSDNQYEVTIRATSTTATQQEQNITVTITNLPEVNKTSVPLIIIRVNFANYTFGNDAATWNTKIFGNSTKGQLNHYLNEISHNSFQFTPATETDGVNDGIITVTLNQDHPNVGSVSNTNQMKPILKLALDAADTFIDFSSFNTGSRYPAGALTNFLELDKNIDKTELQIMFLWAGGESAYGTNPGVWAHASSLTGLEYDGFHILQGIKGAGYSEQPIQYFPEEYGGYSVFGEKQGTNDATIGVIAHELGHALWRLPDLYDTDGSSNGIGYFGLMGAGSNTADSNSPSSGSVPTHPSAWSKIRMGFITPTTITSNTSNQAVIATGSNNYKPIKVMTKIAGEYFLIENRSASGYDSGLAKIMPPNLGSVSTAFTGGMAIWHIDDNKQEGTIPSPYNRDENHKAVDLEEADQAGLDTLGNRGHLQNLFYAGNITTFSNITTPNSKHYNGETTGILINNISTASNNMSCDINYSN